MGIFSSKHGDVEGIDDPATTLVTCKIGHVTTKLGCEKIRVGDYVTPGGVVKFGDVESRIVPPNKKHGDMEGQLYTCKIGYVPTPSGCKKFDEVKREWCR